MPDMYLWNKGYPTFPVSMDGPQKPEASPEADARFEARVEELRDEAFGWFESLIHKIEKPKRMGPFASVFAPGFESKNEIQVVLRALKDGDCSESQCETLAREILGEEG